MASVCLPRLRVALLILVTFSLAACTTTRRTAPPAEPTDAPTPTVEETQEGWSVHFCSDETVDDNVSLEIGLGDDPATHRFWQAVNPRVNPVIVFPEDLRSANKVWIKMTSENHREVEACVKFDGNATEKFLFNESEEEEIDRADRDDCGC